MTQKIRFRLLADFKITLKVTPVWGKSFWKVLRFALASQKNGFRFVVPCLNFKSLRRLK